MTKKSVFFMTAAFVILLFHAFAKGDTVIKDFDGNFYSEVRIGEQIWLVENLRTTHYNDGTKIAGVFSYDDDEANVGKFGRLYVWDALRKGDVCPPGYRIATDEDYKVLEKHIGMSQADIDGFGWRGGSGVASKLKAADSFFFWQDDYKKNVNKSGFSSVPGGVRTNKGKYGGINLYADYWTSTEDTDNTKAYNRSLVWLRIHPGKNKIYRSRIDKNWGFSVRMIKK